MESRILRGLAFAGILAVGLTIGDRVGQSRERTDLAGHRETSCATCHVLLASTDMASSATADLWKHCSDCHNRRDIAARDRLTFHQDPNRACTDCHSFHTTAQIRAKRRVFRFRFDDVAVRDLCRSCHENGKQLEQVSAAHREAAGQVYHRDYENLQNLSPSEACLTCHSNQMEGFLVTSAENRPPRFNPHAGHTFGRLMTAGRSPGGYSERLPVVNEVPLVHGRIECQTCHDMTSPQKKLLPVMPEGTDLCASCHVRNR